MELCRDEGPFFSKSGAQPVYDLMLAELLQGVATGKASGGAGRWWRRVEEEGREEKLAKEANSGRWGCG